MLGLLAATIVIVIDVIPGVAQDMAGHLPKLTALEQEVVRLRVPQVAVVTQVHILVADLVENRQGAQQGLEHTTL